MGRCHVLGRLLVCVCWIYAGPEDDQLCSCMLMTACMAFKARLLHGLEVEQLLPSCTLLHVCQCKVFLVTSTRECTVIYSTQGAQCI